MIGTITTLVASGSVDGTDGTALVLLGIALFILPVAVFWMVRKLRDDPGDGDPR